MIRYDMTSYDMIWYDMIWYDMIWYDMKEYDIWYQWSRQAFSELVIVLTIYFW